MQPNNPSRRRLLGGILAGLFGGLAAGDNTTASPPPKPAPDGPPAPVVASNSVALTATSSFTYTCGGQTAGPAHKAFLGPDKFSYEATT